LEWRSAWAERANQHLARAGHVVRIDHRTLEAQQSELTPGRNIGVERARQGDPTLPSHLKERVAERQRIAQENGAMIVEDPTVALRALSRQRPIFTHPEIVQFLESRTGSAEQLDAALAAVMRSDELVALTLDGANPVRFTSRDMLEAEKSLMKRVTTLTARRGHGAARPQVPGPAAQALTEEQRPAFDYLVGEGDFKALAATADNDKGWLLAAAREVWELQGLTVAGVALSRIAVERLQASTGIESQTLESLELDWKDGRAPLTLNHVVVVDGAEMIGLKQLERLLAVVDKARGKAVLVGNAGQLQAMGSMSPLQSILDKAASIGRP
jgi:ATP-dependent exoDNAse (exonuclease V) alpha subunit